LQVKAAFEWSGVYQQLAQVKQPTLIVQGMADMLTPPANAQLLATAIPGSWLVRFADGGHGLMYQRPKKLARIIHIFLSD
jgi:pimeloyl-ACP methyl ester carboxylesterase